MAAMTLRVTPAGGADAGELADVAAATFPLACPATVAAEDIAEFVHTHLSAGRFAEYLTDPDRIVFGAHDGGRIVGYTMLIRGIGADPDVARAVPQRPAVELSKMYVLPSHHHSGAAAALMQTGIDWSAAGGATAVWLGVNKHNIRAQRFYRRHGFEVTGSRTFRLGAGSEADFVMVHLLQPVHPGR